ncbi:hypothetical protein ABZX95_11290 [Streptomyces sp. NPDC004232]|uniref:hypothetical protein n=1 Tax=Streptomyces sp. NPDC004232 TaxID=3154454 RepID=UPI001D78B7E4|nr:hypothetical protein [Streptomyces sp. tea 10]
MRYASHALRGISLFVAALTAVGCSAEESKKDFTVPKALCGVSAPADAFSQLLPASGKRLTIEPTGSLEDGSAVCTVKVDGDMVLVVSGERIVAGDSARDILRRRLSVQDQKSAANRSIAYDDHAAVSLIKCRGTKVEQEDVSILIKVLKPGRPDETAMKQLTEGYTASFQIHNPCRAA